jgi:hypothetical protein
MSKTETPKTEIPTNPFVTFEPFHKMMEEYAALEAQMIARAKAAIETWAQLAQDALAYSAQLSAQARKLGLETAKKMGPTA